MKRVVSSVTGVLREYLVQSGEAVGAGQEVAVVESMKMMIPVVAEVGGRVASLTKPVNETVREGETLIELAE